VDCCEDTTACRVEGYIWCVVYGDVASVLYFVGVGTEACVALQNVYLRWPSSGMYGVRW
jgi:hypothetical protein